MLKSLNKLRAEYSFQKWFAAAGFYSSINRLANGGLGSGAPRSMKMEWRNDSRQYSHGLYQGGHEPLGRSARWMQAWGERAGPERPPEVRCRPPKREGLVKRSHGESTRSGLQPTGKSPPASTPCTMGQRTNPEGFSPWKGCHTPGGSRGRRLRQVTWFILSPFGIPQRAG